MWPASAQSVGTEVKAAGHCRKNTTLTHAALVQ